MRIYDGANWLYSFRHIDRNHFKDGIQNDRHRRKRNVVKKKNAHRNTMYHMGMCSFLQRKVTGAKEEKKYGKYKKNKKKMEKNGNNKLFKIITFF